MVFLFSTVGRWVRWPFARFARSDFFFFASLKYINSRAKPRKHKKKKANKLLTFTTAKKYFGTQKYKSMSERIKNQHHIMHNKTKTGCSWCRCCCCCHVISIISFAPIRFVQCSIHSCTRTSSKSLCI